MNQTQPTLKPMLKPLVVVVAALAAVVMVFIASDRSSAPSVANAQDIVQATATPRPRPVDNGGSATWEVKSQTFTSNYPVGGTFEIDVSSTGGKIVAALVQYQHNPSVRKRAEAHFNEASGTWNAGWDTGGTPQWVAVDHWWQLTDESGNVYLTDLVSDEYEDNTRQWKHLASEDIIVHWEATLPEETGQAIVDAMADRREFYYQNWGKLLTYTPRAIIYHGYDAVNEWAPGSDTRNPGIGGGVTTRLGGFTTEGYGAFTGIYLDFSDTPEEMAYGTVLHEIGHLYQYQNGGTFNETWFIEGDAEFMSNYDNERYLERAREIAATGQLAALSNIGRSGREAYDVGYAFWYWFTEKYGADSHLRVWTLIGQGKPGKQASEEITGMTFLEMEVEFRIWLGAPNPVPATLRPTETIFFFPSPTYKPTKTPAP